MIPALATLVVGIIIGYMGQRSTFCTVSGIRDLILRRNSYRFRGLLGIVIGGAIGFAAFKFIGGNIYFLGTTVADNIPNFPLGNDIISPGILIATIVGSLGLGFWSVMAEGCPYRQHVMAAEGRVGAMFYLLGFYAGITYFFLVTVKWLELLLGILR